MKYLLLILLLTGCQTNKKTIETSIQTTPTNINNTTITVKLTTSF